MCIGLSSSQGKSFASTTAQACFIASLVNASGWTSIDKKVIKASPIGAAKRNLSCDVGLSDAPPCKKMKPKTATESSHGQKRSSDAPMVPPMKRCRFKQPDATMQHVVQILEKDSETKKAGRGRPKGTSSKSEGDVKIDRSGKNGCMTVYQKVEMIKEYERLKSTGMKHVESFMLKNNKLRGGYQGCMSESKWLGARNKYKWDMFVEHCPKLSKKVMEVPNTLLEVLGVSVSGLQMVLVFCLCVLSQEYFFNTLKVASQHRWLPLSTNLFFQIGKPALLAAIGDNYHYH